MIKGAGSRSIPLINGSGSGRPKSMWIRIRTPAFKANTSSTNYCLIKTSYEKYVVVLSDLETGEKLPEEGLALKAGGGARARLEVRRQELRHIVLNAGQLCNLWIYIIFPITKFACRISFSSGRICSLENKSEKFRLCRISTSHFSGWQKYVEVSLGCACGVYRV
jgi:hypothetical protein